MLQLESSRFNEVFHKLGETKTGLGDLFFEFSRQLEPRTGTSCPPVGIALLLLSKTSLGIFRGSALEYGGDTHKSIVGRSAVHTWSDVLLCGRTILRCNLLKESLAWRRLLQTQNITICRSSSVLGQAGTVSHFAGRGVVCVGF